MSQVNNPPPGETPPKKKPPSPPAPQQWRSLIVWLPVLLFLIYVWQEYALTPAVKTIPYSEFKADLARGSVVKCRVQETEIDGEIRLGPPKPGEAASGPEAKPTLLPKIEARPQPLGPESKLAKGGGEEPQTFAFRTIRIDDPDLVKDLEKGGVRYEGVRPSLLSSFLMAWILPLVLFGFVWFVLAKRLGSAGQAVMSIGKSRARLVADEETGVTFADVAGCDEAKYELQEVVDFLKNPRRYEALGAKIPKGILLVGPPGTGKTLMARAVAGEAHVSFFSISGSDFVEMFVGVGAARVRDLFETAKKQAPCIIFIDELDAIGRQRGIHITSTNDEREQTLNQLLVEMDGFAPNLGVIILAATNRPDVLDRALLRPGRFDRQVVVDAPDVDGREAILKVHARGKRLGDDVNLRKIAQGTVGFSGADLANALNEAALLAARRGGDHVTQNDLEEAVEKLVAGPERTSRRLDADEKRRVACHEVGHALVASYSKYADPVHKISIVPRGRAALGYTLQLPTSEQFLLTRSALLDRLKGLLGGRAAEEVVFNEVSTGAENDLQRATAMARQMVCMFGMSETVGLAHYANPQAEFLGPMPDPTLPKECSETTLEQIDAEVKNLLDVSYREAKDILREHREQLDRVVDELLQRESLDAVAFNRLLGRPAEGDGQPTAPAVPLLPSDHAPTI